MQPIRLTGRRPKARRTAHHGRLTDRCSADHARPPSANPRQDPRGQRHLTVSTVRTPGPHVHRPAGSAPTRVLSRQWHAAYWPISTPPTQSHTRTPTKHANITASAANTASATQTFDALTPPNNTPPRHPRRAITRPFPSPLPSTLRSPTPQQPHQTPHPCSPPPQRHPQPHPQKSVRHIGTAVEYWVRARQAHPQSGRARYGHMPCRSRPKPTPPQPDNPRKRSGRRQC
jgi:hypothetical protein